MSGRARCGGSDVGNRQKRKRVGFADTPTQLKSPCNKAARSDFFNVFLVGFSEKEKADIVRNSVDEIDVKEVLSTSVTHLVVKLPTKRDKPYPYAALYYAVVSGAWILRPSWLALSKDGVMPECDHEFRHDHIDIQTPMFTKFRDIIRLYENYQKLRDREGCRIFSDSVFKRVFILANRTCEGRQKKAMLRSLIHAGGGSIAVDDSWRAIRERPSKAAALVSIIIIENGEDLSNHEINISFIKQLLMKGVPVLYEEILSQLLHNQVVPNLEIMMTHAVYYWCNEHNERLTLSQEDLECVRKIHLKSADRNDNHGAGKSSADSTFLSNQSGKLSNGPDGYSGGDASEGNNRFIPLSRRAETIATTSSRHTGCNWSDCGYDLLHDVESEIEKNQLREGANETCLQNIDEDHQQHSMLVDHVAGDLNEVEDDCGLFEVIDAHQGYDVTLPSEGGSWSDKMSTLGHLVPKALARSGVESASFSDNLRQFFEAIMVEMENNIPSSFIHDFICHEVVTSLRDSLYPLFLPTPNILSRLFHDIAKPEFGQQFDAANAVYRLLMFFLYHFPACNEEGRFYWLQVLTDDPSNGDSPSSNGRRGSLLKWNSLLSRTAGFRKMVLDTFTCDGCNLNLMEFVVSVLEVDLFNMEGCDGLNTSQDSTEDGESYNHSSCSLASDDVTLPEQLHNSSILHGVPLSCMVFYDPHERRKRGLDKAAMEICFAIVDNAVSTESILCADLCWRLLAVCLEGLRFFLANTMKLFHPDQISIDLRMDVERLGRYLVKKGLTFEEIAQFLPLSWISDTIRAMN